MRRWIHGSNTSPPRVSSLRLTSRPSQREGEAQRHDLAWEGGFAGLITRSITCVLTLVLALTPGVSNAFDETDSFALLVETLESSDDPSVQAALLKGMLSGLEGRRNVHPPRGWTKLNDKLAASENAAVRERSLALSQIFGDQAAVARALASVKDPAIEAGQRRTALSLLLNQQSKEASNLLKSLIDEPAMTLDAIRGYAVVENKEGTVGAAIELSDLEPQQQRAVIETLAARKVYAEALLEALQMSRFHERKSQLRSHAR